MKKKKSPRMSDLVADEKLREQFKEALYSGKPLLGEEGGIFTDLLQAFVNASLEGELDHHLSEEKAGICRSRHHETGILISNQC